MSETFGDTLRRIVEAKDEGIRAERARVLALIEEVLTCFRRPDCSCDTCLNYHELKRGVTDAE